MKILHVVTYISPNLNFGGPARVALNQAKSLTEMDHEIVVAAAGGGFGGMMPHEFDGVKVKLFPGYRVFRTMEFAGMTSPRLFMWLIREIRRVDVVHVHMARDLVTLPSAALALLLRKPVVLQTHGMVDPSNKLLAGPLDAVLTKRVMRLASKILYLTDKERKDLTDVAGGKLKLEFIPNGVTIPNKYAVEQANNPTSSLEVITLGRLEPRKRPWFMTQAAESLRTSWPDTRFTLIGPDQGEAADLEHSIQKAGLMHRVRWEGALPPDKTTDRLCNANIFALPAINETFPMAVLEAMAVGLPAVITATCGLAPFVRENNAGLVCADSSKEFTSALEKLLKDAELRKKMGSNARVAIKECYSSREIARRLIAIYETVCSGPRRSV